MTPDSTDLQPAQTLNVQNGQLLLGEPAQINLQTGEVVDDVRSNLEHLTQPLKRQDIGKLVLGEIWRAREKTEKSFITIPPLFEKMFAAVLDVVPRSLEGLPQTIDSYDCIEGMLPMLLEAAATALDDEDELIKVPQGKLMIGVNFFQEAVNGIAASFQKRFPVWIDRKSVFESAQPYFKSHEMSMDCKQAFRTFAKRRKPEAERYDQARIFLNLYEALWQAMLPNFADRVMIKWLFSRMEKAQGKMLEVLDATSFSRKSELRELWLDRHRYFVSSYEGALKNPTTVGAEPSLNDSVPVSVTSIPSPQFSAEVVSVSSPGASLATGGTESVSVRAELREQPTMTHEELRNRVNEIFEDLLREGKIRFSEHSDVFLEAFKYSKGMYDLAVEKCPEEIGSRLDLFPLEYWHRILINRDGRDTPMDDMESWMCDFTDARLREMTQNIHSVFALDIGSQPKGVTRKYIVGVIENSGESIRCELAKIPSAPSKAAIDVVLTADVFGLTAAVIRRCPDPLRSSEDLEPLRECLKIYRTALANQRDPLKSADMVLWMKELQRLLKMFEEQIVRSVPETSLSESPEAKEMPALDKKNLLEITVQGINLGEASFRSKIDKPHASSQLFWTFMRTESESIALTMMPAETIEYKDLQWNLPAMLGKAAKFFDDNFVDATRSSERFTLMACFSEALEHVVVECMKQGVGQWIDRGDIVPIVTSLAPKASNVTDTSILPLFKDKSEHLLRYEEARTAISRSQSTCQLLLPDHVDRAIAQWFLAPLVTGISNISRILKETQAPDAQKLAQWYDQMRIAFLEGYRQVFTNAGIPMLEVDRSQSETKEQPEMTRKKLDFLCAGALHRLDQHLLEILGPFSKDIQSFLQDTIGKSMAYAVQSCPETIAEYRELIPIISFAFAQAGNALTEMFKLSLDNNQSDIFTKKRNEITEILKLLSREMESVIIVLRDTFEVRTVRKEAVLDTMTAAKMNVSQPSDDLWNEWDQKKKKNKTAAVERNRVEKACEGMIEELIMHHLTADIDEVQVSMLIRTLEGVVKRTAIAGAPIDREISLKLAAMRAVTLKKTGEMAQALFKETREQPSITKDEIIALCEEAAKRAQQKLLLELGESNSFALGAYEGLMDAPIHALKTCPDISIFNAGNYELLGPFEQSCYQTYGRAGAFPNIDERTRGELQNMSPNGLKISPEELKVLLAFEAEMQVVFADIQKRLGIQTVAKHEFLSSFSGLMRPFAAKLPELMIRSTMDARAQERYQNLFSMLAQLGTFVDQCVNALPERIDKNAASHLFNTAMSTMRAGAHFFTGDSASVRKKYGDSAAALAKAFDALLKLDFPDTPKGAVEAKEQPSMTKVEVRTLCEDALQRILARCDKAFPRHTRNRTVRDMIHSITPHVVDQGLSDCPEVLTAKNYEKAARLRGMCFQLVRHFYRLHSIGLEQQSLIVGNTVQHRHNHDEVRILTILEEEIRPVLAHIHRTLRIPTMHVQQLQGVWKHSTKELSLPDVTKDTTRPIPGNRSRGRLHQFNADLDALSKTIVASLPADVDVYEARYITHILFTISAISQHVMDDFQTPESAEAMRVAMHTQKVKELQDIDALFGQIESKEQPSMENLFLETQKHPKTSEPVTRDAVPFSQGTDPLLDSTSWDNNTIFEHEIPENFGPALQGNALLTRDVLQGMIGKVFSAVMSGDLDGKLGIAKARQGTDMKALMVRFREIARAVITDVTGEGAVQTVEGYRRLIGGFGVAIDVTVLGRSAKDRNTGVCQYIDAELHVSLLKIEAQLLRSVENQNEKKRDDETETVPLTRDDVLKAFMDSYQEKMRLSSSSNRMDEKDLADYVRKNCPEHICILPDLALMMYRTVGRQVAIHTQAQLFHGSEDSSVQSMNEALFRGLAGKLPDCPDASVTLLAPSFLQTLVSPLLLTIGRDECIEASLSTFSDQAVRKFDRSGTQVIPGMAELLQKSMETIRTAINSASERLLPEEVSRIEEIEMLDSFVATTVKIIMNRLSEERLPKIHRSEMTEKCQDLLSRLISRWDGVLAKMREQLRMRNIHETAVHPVVVEALSIPGELPKTSMVPESTVSDGLSDIVVSETIDIPVPLTEVVAEKISESVVLMDPLAEAMDAAGSTDTGTYLDSLFEISLGTHAEQTFSGMVHAHNTGKVEVIAEEMSRVADLCHDGIALAIRESVVSGSAPSIAQMNAAAKKAIEIVTSASHEGFTHVDEERRDSLIREVCERFARTDLDSTDLLVEIDVPVVSNDETASGASAESVISSPTVVSAPRVRGVREAAERFVEQRTRTHQRRELEDANQKLQLYDAEMPSIAAKLQQEADLLRERAARGDAAASATLSDFLAYQRTVLQVLLMQSSSHP